MCFRDHIEKMIDRAKVRMGLLSRVTSFTWGLETGVLRMTAETLITSLIRYGLSVWGAMAYEQYLKKIDTAVINPMARKVLGTGISARLPTLHATAGVKSMRNIFAQHCAELLDSSLRATKSTIQRRLPPWTANVYGVEDWEVATMLFKPEVSPPPRIFQFAFYDCDVAESWRFRVLKKSPVPADFLKIHSVFYSDATEIESTAQLKALTYGYEGAHNWNEIGAQVLGASGWRPDCAVPQSINVSRAIPPTLPCSAPILFSGMEPPECGHEEHKRRAGNGLSSNGEGLNVTAGAFYQNKFGISCACACLPRQTPVLNGLVLGMDPVSTGPPQYILEGSLLHALTMVEGLQSAIEANREAISHIVLQAGSWRAVRDLRSWIHDGTLTMNSAAASQIAKVLFRVRDWLCCPLIIRELPADFFRDATPADHTPAGLLLHAAERLYTRIIPEGLESMGDKIARVPWTKEEAKAHLKRKYHEDEHQTLVLLAKAGSYACHIHKRLNLSKAVIYEAFKRFAGTRQSQVLLANILRGTFFKYYEKGVRLQVRCPLCTEICCLQHLCSHLGATIPQCVSPEEIIDYLVRLIEMVAPQSKTRPKPIQSGPSGV